MGARDVTETETGPETGPETETERDDKPLAAQGALALVEVQAAAVPYAWHRKRSLA